MIRRHCLRKQTEYRSLGGIVTLLVIAAIALFMAMPLIQTGHFLIEVPIELWWRLDWQPDLDHYGIGTSLAGSTALLLYALPPTLLLSHLIAQQLVETQSHAARSTLITLLQTWASLPSVIIGLWIMASLVPFIQSHLGQGYTLFTSAVGLTLFITPALTLLIFQNYQHFHHAFRPLADSLEMNGRLRLLYYLKSYRTETRHTLLYGFCRLFGETMIVLMLSGNALNRSFAPFESIRSLTATIALEMGYASQWHEMALYALASLALLITLIILLLGKNSDAYPIKSGA